MAVTTKRLGPGDRKAAREMFAALADAFEEEPGTLSDTYIDRLLARTDLWLLAAWCDGVLAGGLTAHTLPMTRSESTELFIYDIGVRTDHQRRGIGRALIQALRQQASVAGIADVFVPAENEDVHAVDFYRALGGEACAVTHFTF